MDAFYLTVALTRTSRTMLNRSDESWFPPFVPDLKGKEFSLTKLSLMLAVGFSCKPFITMRKFPFIPGLLTVMKRYWILFLLDFISYIHFNFNILHQLISIINFNILYQYSIFLNIFWFQNECFLNFFFYLFQ